MLRRNSKTILDLKLNIGRFAPSFYKGTFSDAQYFCAFGAKILSIHKSPRLARLSPFGRNSAYNIQYGF